VHYIYLDQNIIDRIDKGLKEGVVKFLEENRFIPVVSFTSLDEIEHGNHIERTYANIQALIGIGASIICEGNSELLITKIARADKVFELLLRKNRSIPRIIRCLETRQFCKIISTSRDKLKINLKVLLSELK
jgi:hypothetical protein